MFGTLIIETAKSDDSVPVDRNPNTGEIILLDAAYSLHDNHSEAQYERIIKMISDIVKSYGHPCGVWNDEDVPGVAWTIV